MYFMFGIFVVQNPCQKDVYPLLFTCFYYEKTLQIVNIHFMLVDRMYACPMNFLYHGSSQANPRVIYYIHPYIYIIQAVYASTTGRVRVIVYAFSRCTGFRPSPLHNRMILIKTLTANPAELGGGFCHLCCNIFYWIYSKLIKNCVTFRKPTRV